VSSEPGAGHHAQLPQRGVANFSKNSTEIDTRFG
jgi:hypothetical protein